MEGVTEAEQQTEQPKPQFTKKQIGRITQPAFAMLLSLIVTLAVVIPIILINPSNQNNDYDPQIDVAQAAQEGSAATPVTLLAPEVPEEWYASFARWRHDNAAEISYWEVGYVTAEKEFLGVTQAIEPNASWLHDYTQEGTSEGTVMAAGYPWEASVKDDNTFWVLNSEGTDLPGADDGRPQTIILTSSGTEEQLKSLAEATIAELK